MIRSRNEIDLILGFDLRFPTGRPVVKHNLQPDLNQSKGQSQQVGKVDVEVFELAETRDRPQEAIQYRRQCEGKGYALGRSCSQHRLERRQGTRKHEQTK